MKASATTWNTTGIALRQHHQQQRSLTSNSDGGDNDSDENSQKREQDQHWADPASKDYKFWNREEYSSQGKDGQYQYLLKISPESVQNEARILCLGDPGEGADRALHTGPLPLGATLVGVGTTLNDFDTLLHQKNLQPNVVFVSPSCPRAAEILPDILNAFPSVEWIHCRSAGIDFVESDGFGQATTQQNRTIPVTNAKGQFSSSLAEYALMACSYFAKDLPRLVANQQDRKWEKYDVEELRGKTVGIIGYGDIGRACAKLCSVYGMRIMALRRNPFLSRDDPYCDVVYGRDSRSRNQLMANCDYIICSAPSTVETRGMVDAAAFEAVKPGAVFINLGRGPVVDENALIRAIKSGRLRGAALDVFAEEPLPQSSELWDLGPRVLISPHNMDQTATFMHEATDFFLEENLPRFLCGEELLNPVDPQLGY